MEPSPERSDKTWAEFLRIHAATLWQCDFFSQQVLTFRGWRTYFVLVFLHVESRRVFVSPSTEHPTGKWVDQQAQAFLEHARREGHDLKKLILTRDRDGKYQSDFDSTLKRAGVEVRPLPPRSPNLHAFVERWILSLRQECLWRFLVIGRTHLDFLVREWVSYFLVHRPHQGLDNNTLPVANSHDPPTLAFPHGEVICEERLGGVIKHFRRTA